MSARRVTLRHGRSQLLITREAAQIVEALLRSLILRARLAQIGLRVVDVLRGDGAFLQQLAAIVIDRLLGVERIFRGPRVEFGLLEFLWHGRACGRLVGRLCLFERGAALGSDARQILILELGEQLTGAHLRTALHVGLLNRRRELGHDRGLLARVDQPFGADRALDLRQQYGRDVDRHDRRGVLIAFVAARVHRHERNADNRGAVACPHQSKPSGQSLQLRQRHTIARLTVVHRVARLNERVLRIDDFQGRRFTCLIP